MLFGIGVNDMPKPVNRSLPYYQIWQDMLRRCYDSKSRERNISYEGCQVCDEWLKLSNFWKWAELRWKPGLQLDKDIIQPGNKLYSPEYCCFVTRTLNSLLNDMRRCRGEWPQGVCFQGRFKASCSVDGQVKHLGYFDTAEEAHRVYIKFKVAHIRDIANKQSDKHIAKGLRSHAENLEKAIE